MLSETSVVTQQSIVCGNAEKAYLGSWYTNQSSATGSLNYEQLNRLQQAYISEHSDKR